MPAAQSSTLPDRRPIAVGIIGRIAGRTVTIIRTADGATGTITSRCPVCRRILEGCICTGTVPAVPTQQTFDDGSDACLICERWICQCPTQPAHCHLAVAR
ncbi:hypothetical protein OHB07_16250 [Streptomyces sp. NBC_00111]|uniref:hypothetical protein n=1 Tax=Streptomyces sp. NBC_00111 TaxID=2975655 RepID=UPI003249491E